MIVSSFLRIISNFPPDNILLPHDNIFGSPMTILFSIVISSCSLRGTAVFPFDNILFSGKNVFFLMIFYSLGINFCSIVIISYNSMIKPSCSLMMISCGHNLPVSLLSVKNSLEATRSVKKRQEPILVEVQLLFFLTKKFIVLLLLPKTHQTSGGYIIK